MLAETIINAIEVTTFWLFLALIAETSGLGYLWCKCNELERKLKEQKQDNAERAD